MLCVPACACLRLGVDALQAVFRVTGKHAAVHEQRAANLRGRKQRDVESIKRLLGYLQMQG